MTLCRTQSVPVNHGIKNKDQLDINIVPEIHVNHVIKNKDQAILLRTNAVYSSEDRDKFRAILIGHKLFSARATLIAAKDSLVMRTHTQKFIL